MEGKRSLSYCSSRQQLYYKAIIDFLDRNSVEYRTVHHKETYTSEQSAQVRGVSLSTGGKALLLKIGDDANSSYFSLFVMSASRKLNSKAVKKEFKSNGKACKNIRFASSEELAEVTDGLVPGCVPPFGKPILKPCSNCNDNSDGNDVYLNLYVDTSIEENESIAFNAGSLTDSVIMSVKDYLHISAPTGIFCFSKI